MLKWPIMCGRFSRTQSGKELQKRFEFELEGLELEPRYNFAPGQDGAVVVEDEKRRLRLMRWGLVPSWAKDTKTGYKAINARSETLAQKPMFKGLLKGKRCLVLADGFYEWRKTASGNKPMRYVLKDRASFAFAGLWDRWQDAGGEALYTFTIVTTGANELIQPVHDRMPVILKPEHEQAWLNPELKDPEDLGDLLGPYPSELMEGYAVSPACNSPAREGPECILPAPQEGELFD
jgi:putative SOS response-associated peptidase YedK